jgi:hypothetical protein
MGIVRHKQNCRKNHRTGREKPKHLRFNPLQS